MQLFVVVDLKKQAEKGAFNSSPACAWLCSNVVWTCRWDRQTPLCSIACLRNRPNPCLVFFPSSCPVDWFETIKMKCKELNVQEPRCCLRSPNVWRKQLQCLLEQLLEGKESFSFSVAQFRACSWRRAVVTNGLMSCWCDWDLRPWSGSQDVVGHGCQLAHSFTWLPTKCIWSCGGFTLTPVGTPYSVFSFWDDCKLRGVSGICQVHVWW